MSARTWAVAAVVVAAGCAVLTAVGIVAEAARSWDLAGALDRDPHDW